ncbi:MAG: response regulator [Myxococcales bacterium]|nr:response regulator [Myxococcales bacterium]MCB9752123.1 response regulator [Myxococcales bacterium]
MTLESITALVGCAFGAALLLRALFVTNDILEFIVRTSYTRTWNVLRAFIVVFVAGYAAAMVIVLLGHVRWLGYVLGAVFLLGSLFVYLVVYAAQQALRGVIAPEDSRGAAPSVIDGFQLPPSLETADERHVSVSKAPGTIAVIDDDPLSRVLLEKMISGLGHKVRLYDRARAALAGLERDPDVDVILLDLVMPDMSGLKVLRALQRHALFRSTPVLMVSAVDDTRQTAECIEQGAVDFLHKPFDAALLRARLEASLVRGRILALEREAKLSIERERQRADELLRVILPGDVVDELATTRSVAPRRHDHVAVLFADLVGFTRYSERREPEEVHALLQTIVAEWEALAQRHGVQKIKTIGDAFMGACGLRASDDRVVARCVAFGVEMIEALRRTGCGMELRVGVHVGPVAAGIVGSRQFLFDIWGDAVNTAQRVEANGVKGHVCVSAQAQRELAGGFSSVSLGQVVLKGKGPLELFRVRAPKRRARAQRRPRVTVDAPALGHYIAPQPSNA